MSSRELDWDRVHREDRIKNGQGQSDASPEVVNPAGERTEYANAQFDHYHHLASAPTELLRRVRVDLPGGRREAVERELRRRGCAED